VEHGSHVCYSHEGTIWRGEVSSIFQMGDPTSWEDVKCTSYRGGFDDAVRRLRATGGGLHGQPQANVKMGFRVTPYVTMEWLTSNGKVTLEDVESEQKAPAARRELEEGGEPEQTVVELFAMFGVAHVVTPSEITSFVTGGVSSGREEAVDTQIRNVSEAPSCQYYSHRSVLTTLVQVPQVEQPMQHFTVFQSERLPKPFYKLFDSSTLKRRLRKKPARIPVLRLPVGWFQDAFKCCNLGRSPDAGYVTLLGLAKHRQDQLKNLLPVHLIPPNADFRAAIEPFLFRVRQLEEGVFLNLGSKIGWVFAVGGVALCRLDMPAGNDMVGCTRQNSRLGCRRCLTHKKNFDKVLSQLAVARVVRTKQGEDEIRKGAEILAKGDKTEEAKILGRLGYSAQPGPLSTVRIDPTRQVPFEILHSEKIGFVNKFNSSFCAMLNEEALVEFNERVANLLPFSGWSSRVKPVQLTKPSKKEDQSVKGSGTQQGMLASVMVFLVRNWLRPDCFRDHAVKGLEDRLGGDWLKDLEEAIGLVARSNAVLFATNHKDDEQYPKFVSDTVVAARRACARIWPKKFKNPTCHVGSHAAEMAVDVGGARNMNGSHGEVKHKEMKHALRGFNGVFTHEAQMLRIANFRQSSLHIARGGYVHMPPNKFGKGFVKVLQSEWCMRMLNSLDVKNKFYGVDNEEGIRQDMGPSSASDSETSSASGSDSDSSTGGMGIDTHRVTVGSVVCGPDLDVDELHLDLSCLDLLHRSVSDPGLTEAQQVSVRAVVTALKTALETGGREDMESAKRAHLKMHARAQVAGRPQYCSRVSVGCYYTVAVPGPVAAERIARVEAILQYASQIWVLLTWMDPSGVDKRSGLRILEGGPREVRLLDDVLEPRFVVHLCDETCATLGPGFVGSCTTTSKQFLDNEFIII
jgi:hypothetical protein